MAWNRSVQLPLRAAAELALDKLAITDIAAFVVPIGGQRIELQQLDYVHGGLPLLRTRIREGKRFTIFDIDHQTAAQWGEALVRWAGDVRARTEA